MSNILYPAILCLQDGTFYKGLSFFKQVFSSGEIVFNTGMTGYQEILTDPSYSNQVILFTYPEIGNTGLNYYDNESKFIHIKGIIAKNISLYSNNWRSQISLKDYLIKKSIPHIFSIDTRTLTKHLRDNGSMNGYIASTRSNLDNRFLDKDKVEKIDLVRRVTSKKILNFKCSMMKQYNVSVYPYMYKEGYLCKFLNLNIVVVDFGIKSNIIQTLLYYNCNLFIVPAIFSYSHILDYKPDGIILSNGPGNPSIVTYAVNTIKKIIKFSNIPILGICMGHQLLSLALGASTSKLKFGHRGLNHPAGSNQYSEITSQNHGFVVNASSLKTNSIDNIIKVNHLNLNDLTVAGILYKSKPIFSVQYHPEASPGPHDADYLFNIFIKLIEIMKNNMK